MNHIYGSFRESMARNADALESEHPFWRKPMLFSKTKQVSILRAAEHGLGAAPDKCLNERYIIACALTELSHLSLPELQRKYGEMLLKCIGQIAPE